MSRDLFEAGDGTGPRWCGWWREPGQRWRQAEASGDEWVEVYVRLLIEVRAYQPQHCEYCVVRVGRTPRA